MLLSTHLYYHHYLTGIPTADEQNLPDFVIIGYASALHSFPGGDLLQSTWPVTKGALVMYAVYWGLFYPVIYSPYHPCMVCLYTYIWFISIGHVGKYYHTWDGMGRVYKTPWNKDCPSPLVACHAKGVGEPFAHPFPFSPTITKNNQLPGVSFPNGRNCLRQSPWNCCISTPWRIKLLLMCDG